MNSPFYTKTADKDSARSLYEEGWALTHMLKFSSKYGFGFSEVVRLILAERCELAEEYRVSFKELYREFSTWCKDLGEEPLSQTALASRLTEKGFQPERTAGQRFRKGLRMRGFPEL